MIYNEKPNPSITLYFSYALRAACDLVAAILDGVKQNTSHLGEFYRTTQLQDSVPAPKTEHCLKIPGNHMLKEGGTANIVNLRHI